MMSELEVTATVAEIVNDILNDDQRRSLVINIVPRKMYSVETTDMTETECTNPEAECEKNSDSTGYRWCGSTQTCVPPGGPFPLSCFTDAPTPEEACEKNSDSTGYRWCGAHKRVFPQVILFLSRVPSPQKKRVTRIPAVRAIVGVAAHKRVFHRMVIFLPRVSRVLPVTRP